MSQQYRVKVFLCGFDEGRASELKSILKIYHNSQGEAFFRDALKRAHEGERVQIYETNNDVDAHRVAQAYLRGGAAIQIDGLEDKDSIFLGLLLELRHPTQQHLVCTTEYSTSTRSRPRVSRLAISMAASSRRHVTRPIPNNQHRPKRPTNSSPWL